MSKFKVGDLVYIADSSEYRYQGIDHDGKKMSGQINDISSGSIEHDDVWWRVVWSNGESNAYRNEDLIHQASVTIQEISGFKIGEMVEGCETGWGLGPDHIGTRFVIVEFGTYSGRPGVKLKYASNGKIKTNPPYDDFVDVRSIKKTSSADEPERRVTFKVGDLRIEYRLSDCNYYDNQSGDMTNGQIFEALGMSVEEKNIFAAAAYGYNALGGDWPVWRGGDKNAPIAIIKALRERVAEHNKKITEGAASELPSNADSILAEAQRRYPVGTTYRPLDSSGKYYTDRSATQSVRVCEIVYNDHTGLGIDCGYGYVYLNGTWADVIAYPATEPTEAAGTLRPAGLLEEARRRYPRGTIYLPLSYDGTAASVADAQCVKSECRWVSSGAGIDCSDSGYIYKDGKWAPIIGGTVSSAAAHWPGSVLTSETMLTTVAAPQYIDMGVNLSGTSISAHNSANTLPDQQGVIIVNKSKQKSKIKVL